MPGASIKGTSTLDRALSVLTRTRRSLSRSPTHESPTEPNNTSLSLPTHKVDVLAQAFSLLDGTMEFYLPGDVDPDETSVRDRLKAMAPPPPPGTVHSGPDHGSLDDPVSPLVLLLSRLCLADPTCRRRLRSWLVPKDLDRYELLRQADLELNMSVQVGTFGDPQLSPRPTSSIVEQCISQSNEGRRWRDVVCHVQLGRFHVFRAPRIWKCRWISVQQRDHVCASCSGRRRRVHSRTS